MSHLSIQNRNRTISGVHKASLLQKQAKLLRDIGGGVSSLHRSGCNRDKEQTRAFSKHRIMFTVLFILNPECPLLFKLCENGYDRAAGG